VADPTVLEVYRREITPELYTEIRELYKTHSIAEDARGTAVVEERLDRRADRAAGVEDIVDQHDRAAFERKVELRLADERLSVQRRLAAANVNIVAVEGDVDGAELRGFACALLDQAREPLRDRNAACLDAHERDLTEVGVRLDDLVGDARKRPRDRVGIEEDLPRGLHRAHSAAEIGDVGTCVVIRLLSGLAGPG
jgi:hypothetical protein